MDIFKGNTIKAKSFKWIKKNLDPFNSYIVFENNLNKETSSIFIKNNPVYEYLQKEKILWVQVFDKRLLREYLVIQIDPGKEDEMLGKLISYEFSQNLVYYLYKAEENL